MKTYRLVDHMRHVDQAQQEAVQWHEARGQFKTKAERDAYEAGFGWGAIQARRMMALHGGIKLKD